VPIATSDSLTEDLAEPECARITTANARLDLWGVKTVADGFVGTLQLELLDGRSWATRAARQGILEWIECCYSSQRRHS
jgi:hypothetical protein